MHKDPKWYEDNGLVHLRMCSEVQTLKYNPSYVESLRRAGLRPVVKTNEYGNEYMEFES